MREMQFHNNKCSFPAICFSRLFVLLVLWFSSMKLVLGKYLWLCCLTKLFHSHNHSAATQETAGSQNGSFGHSRWIKIQAILLLTLWELGYDIFVLWFQPKTAVFGCLTNALAPPSIALESCSRAQPDRPAY